jgi:protein involved in polysaccharide export with SLBB domain
MKICSWLLMGIVAVGVTGCGGGSSGGSSVPMASPSQAGAMGSEVGGNADILRVGDIITIRLSGVPVGSGDAGVYEAKVDDAGFIQMPLVGKFKAAGSSTTQLASQIEQAYISQRIYATPSVTIIPQTRFVNVNGEVRGPQRVLYTNDLTALGAITACGGFTEYADKRNILILRGGQVFSFDAVNAQRTAGADVSLQPGDQVQVKRTIF